MTHDELLLEIDEVSVGIDNTLIELALTEKKVKDLEVKIDGTRTLKAQFSCIIHHAKTEAKIIDFATFVKAKASAASCEHMLKTLFAHHAEANKKKQATLEILEVAKKLLQKLKNQEGTLGKVIKHDFRRSTRANKKG